MLAETFTNPLMRAQDIPALVAAAGHARLVIGVDNAVSELLEAAVER